MDLTLTDRDRALLDRMREGPCDVETLARTVPSGRGEVEDRLEELADNALVEEREDGWTLTDEGRRVLEAPGDGSVDDRLDTPPDVEDAIDDLDLRPDREDAVRGTFAFLRHWETATGEELRDAVYDEHPAGYDSPDAWWNDLVAGALADLPGVRRDDGEWRYEGEPDPGEGRWPDDRDEPLASVKHASEERDLAAEERDAVHAVVSTLLDRGAATGEELRDAVYDEHPAGYDSPDAWWDDLVEPTLAATTGVDASDGRFRYAGAESDGV